MVNTIFKEEESSISDTLRRLLKVGDSKFGLIKDFKRVLQYYDEPKLWQYSASINSKFVSHNGGDFRIIASGVSFFSEKLAILKCLGESMERYCNFAFSKKTVDFVGRYNELKREGLDPKSVVSFSKKQLGDDLIFSWTQGISLITNRKTLIPTQLIYLSYHHLPNEPVIYPSISTGCAGGSCLSAALVRGICEIIERDAFIICYLNKLSAPKVQLDQVADDRIQKLLQISKRYKMEIFSFDITTDVLVPAYLSVVINRTGIGKAVSVGTKSSLNPITALVGSIEETFNTRTWLRTDYESKYEKVSAADLLKKSDIKTRGLLWYTKETIKELDFLLKPTKPKLINCKGKIYKSSGKQLEYLLATLKKLGYDVFYKDITIPKFKEMNYFVVKVIIPQLQPFYLNERYKILGGERLYGVPEKLGIVRKSEGELNSFPHPFL